MHQFTDHCLPVLDAYESLGVEEVIDAGLSEDEVYSKLTGVLEDILDVKAAAPTAPVVPTAPSGPRPPANKSREQQYVAGESADPELAAAEEAARVALEAAAVAVAKAKALRLTKQQQHLSEHASKLDATRGAAEHIAEHQVKLEQPAVEELGLVLTENEGLFSKLVLFLQAEGWLNGLATADVAPSL